MNNKKYINTNKSIILKIKLINISNSNNNKYSSFLFILYLDNFLSIL